MAGLTDKRERFCLEYVIDFNKTQAALRAGYSEDTAKEQGYRLFTNVHVQERIEELQRKAITKLDKTHTDVLNQLHNWAYSDITETIELSAAKIKELPLEIRQLITKFKRTTRTGDWGSEEVIELHFVSKEKAIEMIAKHIGFFEVDNKQKESNIVQSIVLSDEMAKKLSNQAESEC